MGFTHDYLYHDCTYGVSPSVKCPSCKTIMLRKKNGNYWCSICEKERTGKAEGVEGK